MKKLIICLACIAILCASCEKPIDNYKGDIVIQEKQLHHSYSVMLQHKTKSDKWRIVEVLVFEHDYNRFNVGDTIK